MKPGIYDISNEEYHASEGISRSGIMQLMKSPRHYWNRYIKEGERKDVKNPYQSFGSVMHTYILEPDEFKKRYFVFPEADKRTKVGKNLAKEAVKEAGSREAIEQDIYDEVVALSEAMEKDNIAKDLIKTGEIEKSIYWIDIDTGVLCKCRPDVLHENMVCDLKMSKDASPRSFRYDMYDYGYYIQAGMIKEGVKAVLGREIESFIYVVLERGDPPHVGKYILDKASIDKGIVEFKEQLVKYKKCCESNEWPSYEPKEISLPAYAL